jgi:hypothetical protein
MGFSRSGSPTETSQAKQDAVVAEHLGNLRRRRDGTGRQVSSVRGCGRSRSAHTKRRCWRLGTYVINERAHSILRATLVLTFSTRSSSTVLEPIFVPLSCFSVRASESQRSRGAPIRHEPARQEGLKRSMSRIATC